MNYQILWGINCHWWGKYKDMETQLLLLVIPDKVLCLLCESCSQQKPQLSVHFRTMDWKQGPAVPYNSGKCVILHPLPLQLQHSVMMTMFSICTAQNSAACSYWMLGMWPVPLRNWIVNCNFNYLHWNLNSYMGLVATILDVSVLECEQLSKKSLNCILLI